MEFMVGCPTHRREWIIEAWIDHVEQACVNAGVEPEYVMVVDPKDPTCDLLQNRLKLYFRNLHNVFCEEDRQEDKRVWNIDRYRRMVYLRNQLLGEVRVHEPDYFLSLDSDILIHPDAISKMINHIESADWGAVGSKTYLSPSGKQFPNYANLTRSGNLNRPDTTANFNVDVLMAIKLMKPAAYNVDYEEDNHGEDIGWSKACHRRGVRLAWDGSLVSKHCMSEADFHKVDERCGF